MKEKEFDDEMEEIKKEFKIKKLELYKKYSYDGVTAWAAKQRNCEPLKQLITKEYKEAFKSLS